MSKYLIVNADDFGYSYSINEGIIEAHTNGIVTSTSVMVDAMAAHEARGLTKFPDLSIGLHLEVKETANIEVELARQVDKFVAITGKSPDHIDTHKRHTTDAGIKEVLENYTKIHGTPVRILNAKHIGSFGISSSDSSVTQLKRSIDEATELYNELMTHAGYADDYLREHSSYNNPREDEIKSVCSPEIKEYIREKGLVLTTWKGVTNA